MSSTTNNVSINSSTSDDAKNDSKKRSSSEAIASEEKKQKTVATTTMTKTTNSAVTTVVSNNTSPDSSNATATTKSSLQLDDVSTALGYKTGDRIEVQWEVCDPAEEENNENNNNNTGAETTENTETEEDGKTRWWGATLKEFDGRYHENTFAIRTLDYDPYPEGGFPERSDEDVIFLDSNTLYSLEQQTELSFKREGDDEIITIANGTMGSEDGMREVLDNVLASALENNQSTWGKLDASQKAIVAEKLSHGKEQLLNALMKQLQSKKESTDGGGNNNSNIITPQDIKNVLAETFGGK